MRRLGLAGRLGGEATMGHRSADEPQPNAEWNQFMARLEAAEVEFAHGRPDDFKGLWSHGDDVTLCGGLGGATEVGWKNVATRLDWASSNYADGTRDRQEFNCQLFGDIAFLVQKEIIEARLCGGTERSRQELRVTMVFRRFGEGWRIIHRHADSQTAVHHPQ